MTLTTADRLDLHDLAARYALHVDRRNLDLVVGLFTVDGELLVPDPPERLDPVVRRTGHAEIRDHLSALREIPVTRHEILGHVLDAGPAGDLATGVVTGVANHVDERNRNLVWYLRYRDSYRREPAGWRLAGRALSIDWIETRQVRRR